jgi:hypothetical protein
MERFLTKEECIDKMAKAQAEMIIWMTFSNSLEKGDTVLVTEEEGKEPLYKIVKAKDRKKH